MDNPLLWLVAAVVLVGGLIYLAIEDDKKWDQFSAAHKCVVVGKTRGDVGVGFVAGGNGGTVTTFTPGKTGWKCDDGITYWR